VVEIVVVLFEIAIMTAAHRRRRSSGTDLRRGLSGMHVTFRPVTSTPPVDDAVLATDLSPRAQIFQKTHPSRRRQVEVGLVVVEGVVTLTTGPAEVAVACPLTIEVVSHSSAIVVHLEDSHAISHATVEMQIAEMIALRGLSDGRMTVAVANGPIVNATWIAFDANHNRRHW
jgi:hypothetical protein